VSYTLTNESTVTTGQTNESARSVSLGFTATAGVKGVLQVTTKYEEKWTWTHSSSVETSTGSSESATVAVGDPSYGYTGVTDIAVYWDTIFHSFLFGPVPFPAGSTGTNDPRAIRAAAFATGRITDAAGHPIRAQEVVLTAPGRKFRTFTNRRGEYFFFGFAARGAPVQGNLQVGTLQKAIAIGTIPTTTDIQLGASAGAGPTSPPAGVTPTNAPPAVQPGNAGGCAGCATAGGRGGGVVVAIIPIVFALVRRRRACRRAP
jgi:hypothetical protein